ncbi:MAG: PqqD family protein [Bacteroidia bacterium]|jgi:hypothetical protein|nr:PqqD family protein [Bacteroidia bacterium]
MVDSFARFRTTNHQVSSNLSGSTVILNHRDGFYYELNEVGTTIWEQLKLNGTTIVELKKLILNEFDVDDQIVESDINKILSELLNEKLVEVI